MVSVFFLTYFPTLFSTSCEMGAPCMPNSKPKLERFNTTSVDLNGTMYFFLVRGEKSPHPYIKLLCKSLTNWMDPLEHSKVEIDILYSALSSIAKEPTKGSDTATLHWP